jgi:nucleoside-diphosphate kinase
MVDELITGPCIAMEVSAGQVKLDPQGHSDTTDPLNNIVAAFRQFVGPFDPEIGRKIRPDSLRALYGEDKVKNAVHCTDLSEDGELEVSVSTCMCRMHMTL